MADEDLELDDGGEGAAAGGGKSKGGGFLPTLLKWLAIVVGAIILIVTVVVITMNIMQGNNSNSTSVIQTGEEYSTKREALAWYTSIGQSTYTTIDVPAASVTVEVILGYKEDDKVASTEITKRQYEIKDYFRRYFSSKSKNELRVQDEDKLRLEIKNAINDDILTGAKIYDVLFLQFSVN